MITRVYPNCAGLDVHKAFVIACRLPVDAQGQTHKAVRRFSTMTQALQALSQWLTEGSCTPVAMASTGVYWQPIYHILEGHFAR